MRTNDLLIFLALLLPDRIELFPNIVAKLNNIPKCWRTFFEPVQTCHEYFDLNLLTNMVANGKFDMFANNVGQFPHTFTIHN